MLNTGNIKYCCSKLSYITDTNCRTGLEPDLDVLTVTSLTIPTHVARLSYFTPKTQHLLVSHVTCHIELTILNFG